MSDEDLCGWIFCRHTRSEHDNLDGCSAKVELRNVRLYGYDQPLIYKSCGCTWVEPTRSLVRVVRDGPQA